MTYAQAVLLGLIQGATEFLPVSSSAHLALAPRLLGFEDPGLTFDLALHAGTLLAVLAYYRGVWLDLARSAWREPRGEGGRSLLMLALACVPAGVAGLLLQDAAETAFRDPRRMAACLIGFSAVMWWADRRGGGAASWREAPAKLLLLVGAAQALALMPGVSRSGATISAALLLGLSRSQAAEFSFLLSTPIVAAAAALKLRHLTGADLTGPFLCAVAVSALSGLAAVGLFLRLLPRGGLAPYAAYRVVLGLAALVWAV